LVRQLQPGLIAERWLALNERDESTHVAHRFRFAPDRREERKLVEAVGRLAPLSHPHILPIEQFTLNVGGGAWIVTPYTGNLEGLVTLAALAQEKGGQTTPIETERALTQLLEAVESAHAAGYHHGAIQPEEIMVDRRGSLTIELYGLRRLLSDASIIPATEVDRDEVRSVVEIGYWLLTGLSAEEPRIRADRLVERLDRRWDEWFDAGLDPMAGFQTASEALGALPGMRREVEERISPVRTVLGRFRRALGAT
jgi:serine/threonine protein kinase